MKVKRKQQGIFYATLEYPALRLPTLAIARMGCTTTRQSHMQKQNLDQEKRSRRGPKPLPPVDLRTHSVNARLNSAELAQLDMQRGEIQRGEYFRVAALHRLPPSIPQINLDAWRDLARLAGNLNQYISALHRRRIVPPLDVTVLLAEVRALRFCLVGKYESEN